MNKPMHLKIQRQPERPDAVLQLQPRHAAFKRFAFTVAVTVVVAVLASCDSTAKFNLPDRKFADIQVITAFPAAIDDKSITRICGPLMGDDLPLKPNGVEFNLNFVSTEVKNTACENDKDWQIKEGELIELSPVRTTGNKPTVGYQNFDMQLDCVEPRGVPTGSCPTGITAEKLTPAVVKYVASTPRCHPDKKETWINVAILLDNTGSTSGVVDPTTFREDNPLPESPSTLSPSDPGDARLYATRLFVQSLNAKDRAIAYYFNEKFPGEVAASNNKGCLSNGKECLSDEDCKGDGSDPCLVGENLSGNKFEQLSISDAQVAAFGSQPKQREYLYTALEDSYIKDGGEGRAPLWHSIDTVYKHLKAQNLPNSHILILTDGPDTCSHGEDLTYVSSDGSCRTRCQGADVNFDQLRQKMVDDKFPVQLHFIQWQANGYKQPDAQQIEMACRSGGTYQFLNFSEMNKSDLAVLGDTMTRAVNRVRFAMGGSWRVGVKLAEMDPTTGSIATGEIWSIEGLIQFKNQLFKSLETPYQYSTQWKFDLDKGNEDRRLLFRKACTGAADCGGGDSCGQNHCDVGGVCRSKTAPDKLPCTGGVCCVGICSQDCTTACQ